MGVQSDLSSKSMGNSDDTEDTTPDPAETMSNIIELLSTGDDKEENCFFFPAKN